MSKDPPEPAATSSVMSCGSIRLERHAALGELVSHCDDFDARMERLAVGDYSHNPRSLRDALPSRHSFGGVLALETIPRAGRRVGAAARRRRAGMPL